ncbi:hypothetical protein IFR04_002630 [Cadophora malorum]|uniref:Uncharacterized protein n=1 Tax=Cadophora malorum TaxID=108018 RepID=A0A8H7WG07_9HELO|nr:hypothetical protein IFR04_002630 [Cadophora malorum]
MYLPVFILGFLGASTLASPIIAETEELTDSPAVLLGREPNLPKWPHNPPTCKTKTVYGPYTLKAPVFGFGQSEEYYAEKIEDLLVVTGHGKDGKPLDSDNKDGEGRDYVVTKCITFSWTTSTWYHTIPGHHHPTSCATTTTVHRGHHGFPTGLPILPKPIPHLGWPGLPIPTKKKGW